jgi:uncharacterized phage-associated protein
MQVQKLVYFAHGWHLAITGEPLIDEQVEAWKWGPVIRSIYRDFREYGSKPIDSKYCPMHFQWEGGKTYFTHLAAPSVDDIPDKAEFTKRFLDKVWSIYGKYTAYQLSNLTHLPDTPWQKTVQKHGGRPPKNTDIPSEIIRDYFTTLASGNHGK